MEHRWTVAGHPEWDIRLITLGRSRVFRVRRGAFSLGYLPSVAELEETLKAHGLTMADLVERSGSET